MQRRALAAVLASASMALGGALAATTVPAQADDSSSSPLRLTAPDRVVARSYGGQVWSDLGISMVAQNHDFRIEAERLPGAAGEGEWWDTRYNSPITATWKRPAEAGGDVALGELDDWSGLKNFAAVRIFKGDKRIRMVKAPGCFNGNSTKVGPGTPTNPAVFPWGCPWNPYTLGSVMGVAMDHRSSLLPEWGIDLRLRPGTYTMTGTVTDKWREVLGISDEDGTVTTQLVVKKARDRWRRADTAVAQRGTDQLEATTEAPTTASAGAPDNEFAPDLRSLPAFDISLNGKGTAMRFGATVWNGGGGPMVIEGFREDHDHEDGGAERSGDDDHSDSLTAYQYYFDGAGNQTGFDRVGEFNYHAANHNHWHFRDFARYRLLNEDMSLAVRSTKASFCLVATDAVDLTVPNADMRPEYTDLGSQCGGRGAQMLRQVLANGHGDTYHQFRAGQAFRIGDLEDGIYYVSVEANPADDPTAEREGRNLMETDYANNDSLRKVRLYTTKSGKRKVEVFQVGMVEEFSFDGFMRQR